MRVDALQLLALLAYVGRGRGEGGPESNDMRTYIHTYRMGQKVVVLTRVLAWGVPRFSGMASPLPRLSLGPWGHLLLLSSPSPLCHVLCRVGR